MTHNPEMLAKVRSRALLDAVADMPCELRIATFIPGLGCAPESTVVPCHLPVIGKGKSTKVSDLFVAAGCLHCHDLLDRRDNRIKWIEENHAVELQKQILRALTATQSRLIELGIITVKNGKVIT